MDFGKWFADKIREKSDLDQSTQKYVKAARSGFRFGAQVEETERLSCKLLEITVAYPLKHRPESPKFDTLIKQISEKLTYFQESLVLIEKDDKNEQAMFRSKSPKKDLNRIEYFELMVSPSADMVLKRILREDREKLSISFVIGFDLIERFINDLCELITSNLAIDAGGDN